MDCVGQIEQRRQAILGEMDTIRSMERASLKAQMLPVKHKGQKEPVMRGPYYVLARWDNGKTHSRRVGQGELEQVKQDVANHKRFGALCKEFEELTERLGALERHEQVQGQRVKKGLTSRSKRTRKWSGS